MSGSLIEIKVMRCCCCVCPGARGAFTSATQYVHGTCSECRKPVDGMLSVVEGMRQFIRHTCVGGLTVVTTLKQLKGESNAI